MGVQSTHVASGTGIDAQYKDLSGGKAKKLPMRIAVIGRGASATSYSTAKRQIVRWSEAREYGRGSELADVGEVLFPLIGRSVGGIPVTFYPLQDADGGAPATGTVTPSGTATVSASYRVVVSGKPGIWVAIPKDADAVAAGAALATSMAGNPDLNTLGAADGATGVLTATAKWDGTSGNSITLAVEGPANAGLSFTPTAMSGGSGDPDVTPALLKIGPSWETLIINCLGPVTDVLDALSAWNDGRWDVMTHKPVAGAVYGTSEKSRSTASTVTDARKLDLTNVAVPAPDSPSAPWVTAAAAVKEIALLANEIPPHNYEGRVLTAVVPGDDEHQWMHPDPDLAVKAGCSTTKVEDGVVKLVDVVTCYHPDGEEPPGHRYVVDHVKISNYIYNIDLLLNGSRYAGAPMIPNEEIARERTAKTPLMLRGDIAKIIDDLCDAAILTDRAFCKSKENLKVWIDSENPKRINVLSVVRISGNTGVRSVTIYYGFYYGDLPVAA